MSETDSPPPDTPDAPPSRRPRRRRHRRRAPLWVMVARTVLGLPLLLAATLALLWVWRLPLLEAAAPWMLARAGLGPARLTVARLDRDGLVLTGVALGGTTLTAERLHATATWESVQAGRLDRVEVTGLDVTAAWRRAGGLDLGPLNTLLAPGDGAAAPPPALPVGTVALSNARLALDTPWGTVRVLGDATLEAAGRAAPRLRADLTAGGAGVFASATVDARPWPDPQGHAEVTVMTAGDTQAGLALDLSGSGLLTLAWDADRLVVRTADLSLSAGGLAPALRAELPPALAAAAEGPLSLRLAPGADATAARLVVPLGTAAPPRLDGRLDLKTARIDVRAEARLQGGGGGGDGHAGGPQAAPALPSGTVGLRLSGRELPLPGVAASAAVAARGELVLDGRMAAWHADTPLTLTLDALTPPLRQALAAAAGRPPAGPLTLALAPRNDTGPWQARLWRETPAGGDPPAWIGTLDAAATLTDGGGLSARLAGALHGRVIPQTGAVTARLEDLGLRAAGLAPSGIESLTVDLASPRLALVDGRLHGALRGTAESGPVALGPFGGKAASLAVEGRLEATASGGLLSVETGVLGLSAAAVGQAWAGPERLTLTLVPDRTHVVAVDITAADGPALTLDAVLAPVTLGGTVQGRTGPVHLAGRLPPTAAVPLAVTTATPGLAAAGWPLRDGTLDLRLRPAGPTLTVTGAVPALPGETAPGRGGDHPLRPLRLRGHLTPDPVDAERLAIDLTVGAPLRSRVLGARGWISRDGRDGRLDLSGAPVPLSTEGVQPWHLYGDLLDLSTSAGTLAVDGHVAWRDGRAPRPDLSFGLADVDAAYGTTRVRALNGVVRLIGFAPLRSPSQELVAAGLDMGLPFTDLVVRFRLDGAGHFVLEEARMELAEGTIRTNEATIPLSGFDRIPLTFTVEGLDLGRLAALTPVSDLTVKGTVDGSVPMVITPGAVRIDTGRLDATGPGLVQYTGEALPKDMQGVDLARRALRDFRYNSLSLTVDGGTEADMTVQAQIEGHNETVLDGHPFQLNLNLSGPLTRMIREGLRSSTIPQRIREQLESMGLEAGGTPD